MAPMMHIVTTDTETIIVLERSTMDGIATVKGTEIVLRDMQVHRVVGVVILTMIERIGTAASVGDHGIDHRGVIVRVAVVATWMTLAAVAGEIVGEPWTMMTGRRAEGVAGVVVVPREVGALAKGAAKRRARSANCECCDCI
jgi:hypothetical protein